MGITDTYSFTVTCPNPNCSNTVESASVHEKRSGYDLSWQEGPNMKKFNLQWGVDQANAPIIKKATCIKCGCEASIKGPF